MNIWLTEEKLSHLEELKKQDNYKEIIGEVTHLLDSTEPENNQKLDLHSLRWFAYLYEFTYNPWQNIEHKILLGTSALLDYYNAFLLSIELWRSKELDDLYLEKIIQIMAPVMSMDIIQSIRNEWDMNTKKGNEKHTSNSEEVYFEKFAVKIKDSKEIKEIYEKIYTRMLKRVRIGSVSVENTYSLFTDVSIIIWDELRLKSYGKSWFFWIIIVIAIWLIILMFI